MEKQLKKNLLFNTAGNLLFYICQYSFTLLVVWLGGFEDAGLLATGMTISNVCLSFASYGMRTFQVSDFEKKYADFTYLKSRFATLLLAGLGCVGFVFVNSYSAAQRAIILTYTGYRLTEALADVFHGWLQRAERMDLVGISFGLRGLFSAAGFAAGLSLTHSLLATVLLLLGLNLGYVALVDVPLSCRRANFSVPGQAGVAALLRECSPLALYSFLNSAVGSVPRYYCERILGAVPMGYFNSIFAPVTILQVAAVYLFVPFITTFARLWADKNYQRFRRGVALIFAAMAGVWVLGAGGVALLGRWGLSFLYPGKPELLDYAGLLQPLVLCAVATIGVSCLCHLLTIQREMRGLIAGNVAGILASLAASPPLLHSFGLYGAAWATLTGFSTQALILLGFLLWRYRRAENENAPT